MAPRSVKAKKTADVKVGENDAPKKGRGKAKVVEETELELAEPEIKEKVVPTSDKKAKRGKKAASETNGQEEANGASEDIAPPAKKGRKKNIEEPLDEKLETHEESPIPEETEHNGDTELEPPQSSAAKGRKKQTKKENVHENPKDSGKGKKNAKQGKSEVDVAEKIENNEEKPKSTGKGRGRKAQSKADKVIEQGEEIEEVVKPDPPATKGKKRGPKSTKEKAVDNETEGIVDDLEEKSVEDVKKGKKNQGKKNITKEDTEADEAKDEVLNIKKRKTAKKEKGKGDSKDDEVLEDESPEPKPGKGKRGQKKAAETDDDPLELEEPSSKRRRKPAEEKAIAAEGKKKAPLKNKAATDYESIDFSNNSKTSNGKDWNFKISSWNVDGIRAWIGKGGLDYIKYEKPDILCLQEIKCSQDKFPEEIVNLQGYHPYWLSGDKDGYAGVGIYTTKLAMNVQYGLQNKELDSEGRIITAEYEQFYLICTYVPNAGRKLVTLPKRLQWNEEFRKYVKELDKKKPVIICGDMNVAHNEIDLANPKTNRKNAGFTDEERAGMTELLGDGFVDTYRHLYPDNSGAYTFWTYMMNSRSKNVGWRLDYFIVSERLLSSVCDNAIRDQVYGSDHCPITLFLHLTSADKPKEF